MREGELGRISGKGQRLARKGEEPAHDLGLVLAIEILCDGTKRPEPLSARLGDGIQREHIPNGRDANLGALWVLQEGLEELEKLLGVLLESLDDVFENGEENVDANFAVCNLGRNTCLVKVGEELWPCAMRDFDAGDGSDDACSRISDKFAGRQVSGDK